MGPLPTYDETQAPCTYGTVEVVHGLSTAKPCTIYSVDKGRRDRANS